MTIKASQFESPSSEYESLNELNLQTLIVGEQKHATTFLVADNNSLWSRGIMSGDLIVANKACHVQHDDVVIACIDGELVTRIYDKFSGSLVCDYEPPTHCFDDTLIQSVVTQSIRSHISPIEASGDAIESLDELNLHNFVVGHKKHAVFYCAADGNNLRKKGIYSGDLMVANRACVPKQGDIVIACYDGALVARVYDRDRGLLLCANKPPIPCPNEKAIEAVITHSIRCHRGLSI